MHDNLRRLGFDVLDVINLRTLAGIDARATAPETLTSQFDELAELRQQHLVGRSRAQGHRRRDPSRPPDAVAELDAI